MISAQDVPVRWVPKSFRRRVFNTIHGLFHPSIRSTIQLIMSKFVWQRTSVSGCTAAIHTKTVLGDFPQPQRIFSHIHVDIAGPIPASNRFRYLFTVIDRLARWPEATPMEDETATSCASALLHCCCCMPFSTILVINPGSPDIESSVLVLY